ncbi:hypothetical protein BGX30_005994, partial [Mortierella sp. GBA39]
TWEQDTSSDNQTLVEFEKELIHVAKHAATARCSQEMFEPAELRLEDGSKAFALLLTSGSKRLQSGSVAYVRSLKRRRPSEIEDIELEVALKGHHYGGLVNTEDYKAAESDAIWHMPFRSNVMIGTLGWNALITCCIILTSGMVIVGPDNPEFHPHEHSRIWIRKDSGHDFYNNLERQTRSKFNMESTFESYAAVDRIFNFYKTIPVTLKSLWEYKINREWSGIKTAAFVFHKLYSNYSLAKTDVNSCLVKSRDRKAAKCQILDIVGEMAEVMADVEIIPVSDQVNKYLTMLAGKVQGEVSDLNKGKVSKAVELRIQMVLLQNSK